MNNEQWMGNWVFAKAGMSPDQLPYLGVNAKNVETVCLIWALLNLEGSKKDLAFPKAKNNENQNVIVISTLRKVN